MGKLVKPKVFFVGFSTIDEPGLTAYLRYTGNEQFIESWKEAAAKGVSPGEILCSLYSKLCYRSLTLGKNSNVSRVRDIEDNLKGTIASAHFSVFEHCQLNFIVTDCSRIYTHEQVRHRSGPPNGDSNAIDNDLPGDGWAYSQTSGRYCRLDTIDLVWDDCLDPVKGLWEDHLKKTEDLVYLSECELGLRKPPLGLSEDDIRPRDCLNPSYIDIAIRLWKKRDALTGEEKERVEAMSDDGEHFRRLHEDREWIRASIRWVPDDAFNFEKRKKLTSAIRRIAPNGQANELGLSVNLRTLRHTVQVRTARFAEVEIRNIYAQIYDLVRDRFPTIFHDAKVEMVDGLPEVKGLVMQPYDVVVGDPKALKNWSTEAIQAELAKRTQTEGQ